MKDKWLGFLREQLPVTITILCSDGFLILFYTLSTNREIEILYPMALSGICYLTYMIWAYIKFSRYQKALLHMKECQDSKVQLYSYSELATLHNFQEVHKRYTTELYKKEDNQIKQHRFLSACVHATKTPITVLQLLVERLEKRDLNEEKFIPQFKEEHKKLLEQLESIMNILRLNEFEKDYMPQPTCLEKELRRIINENRKLFICQHVFPKIEVQGKLPYVYTDKKWHEAMLMQILSNAVKYSKEKNSYLYFTMYAEDGKVILKVQDEGIGIPTYDLERVFEPFFTGKNGRGCKTSSGIGLYFCKEVCSMLKHQIEIQSSVGEGTTVTLRYLAKL